MKTNALFGYSGHFGVVGQSPLSSAAIIFILRDATSTAEEVYSRLFDINGGDAQMVEDRSRRIIAAAFDNIRVFCLCTPAAEEMDDPGFNLSMCSPRCQSQIIERVKESLAADCANPRVVQDVPLNGVMIADMVVSVMDAINSNAMNVFPGSRANEIVGHIITQTLETAAARIDDEIARQVRTLVDPNALLVTLRLSLSAVRGECETTLRNYPAALVNPRMDEFNAQQESHIIAAEANMRGRILSMLNEAIECSPHWNAVAGGYAGNHPLHHRGGVECTVHVV
jgi:hypothetical protein